MKLKKINENDFKDAINKYSVKKNNLAKDISTADPEKTDLPDRSGDSNIATTNDEDKLKLLGASDNSRDKQYPSNLA